MTKEDLENRFIKLFDLTEGFTAKHFKWIIDEFFSQNVCIPKGENRHPYADILHAGIEGDKIEKLTESGKWEALSLFRCYFNHVEYRIKPSEPIYEWQWLVIINKQAHIVGDGRFHTDKELETFDRYIKIEETKRIRK